MMKNASLASPSFTITAPGENSVGAAELRIDLSWRVDNPLKSGAERSALISWEKAQRTPTQLATTTKPNKMAGTSHAVTTVAVGMNIESRAAIE